MKKDKAGKEQRGRRGGNGEGKKLKKRQRKRRREEKKEQKASRLPPVVFVFTCRECVCACVRKRERWFVCV